ncbi:hypothetical protein [Novosphingobium colocasiae]|uniref:hypothetical protein n=1 Tax=Novosphingobium colocasiae TaxID=1256513 RepID=UPI0035B1C238
MEQQPLPSRCCARRIAHRRGMQTPKSSFARQGDIVVIEEAATLLARSTMRDQTITVKARIRLLSKAEGGRASPIRGSFRPNHNFFGADDREMTIGQIDLPDNAELQPGASIDLAMTFLNWPGLEGQIYPGREWRIQEGARLIGTGTVLEVLPSGNGLTVEM